MAYVDEVADRLAAEHGKDSGPARLWARIAAAYSDGGSAAVARVLDEVTAPFEDELSSLLSQLREKL